MKRNAQLPVAVTTRKNRAVQFEDHRLMVATTKDSLVVQLVGCGQTGDNP